MFKATSRIIRGSLTPQWQELFYFSIPNGCEEAILYFRILDYDLVISDDFLGHCSISLLSALEDSNRSLSAGWQALLRSGDAQQRLNVLRDPYVAEAPSEASGLMLRAAPGQESTYDLSSAKLFVKVSVTSRSIKPLLQTSLSAHDLSELAEMDEGTASQLLGEAAYNNNPWAVVAILSLKLISVNTVLPGPGEFQKHTALLIACLQKHSALAMILVDVFSASLVSRAPDGRSAAMCACEAQEELLAEWLISEGVPADLVDDAGWNVLFYAVKEAFSQLTAFLLGKQRLSPMLRAADGATPLSVAVGSKLASSVVVAKQLLEAQAAVDCADKKGNLPLHEACKAGNEQCTKLLLSHGNVRMLSTLDGDGLLPCDLAKAAGLPQATLMLLQAGESHSVKPKECGRQQGESFEDAQKRELRARKAAISAEADASWQAWRAQHPRTDADLDRFCGQGETISITVEELEDPYFSLTQKHQVEEMQATSFPASKSMPTRKTWGVSGFFSSKGGSNFKFRSWMKRSARDQSQSPCPEGKI